MNWQAQPGHEICNDFGSSQMNARSGNRFRLTTLGLKFNAECGEQLAVHEMQVAVTFILIVRHSVEKGSFRLHYSHLFALMKDTRENGAFALVGFWERGWTLREEVALPVAVQRFSVSVLHWVLEAGIVSSRQRRRRPINLLNERSTALFLFG